MKTLADIFHDLRFDKYHHLGLGDIRLTLGHQEEIAELYDARIRLLETALSTAAYHWREWMDEARGIHPLDDSSNDEWRDDWLKCMALIPSVGRELMK